MNNLFNVKHKQIKRYKKIKRNIIKDFNIHNLQMRILDSETAIRYISTHHYSKTCTRSISIAFGFYYNNELVGCVVYGTPVGMNVVNSIADNLSYDSVLELTRLFTSDTLPNNVESYIISKTLRYIKQNLGQVKYIVSYADSSFGHVGCIYQATNWLYTGTTERKAKFEYKGREYHARSMYEKYGTSSINYLQELLGSELKVKFSPCKYRYIYVLGQSKVEHKKLLSELKYKVYNEYPKQDIKYYRLE